MFNFVLERCLLDTRCTLFVFGAMSPPETTHPDLGVKVLDDTAVDEETVLEVGDEGRVIYLHLALFQDKLHLKVTDKP